jgi:hypothetical protein
MVHIAAMQTSASTQQEAHLIPKGDETEQGKRGEGFQGGQQPRTNELNEVCISSVGHIYKGDKDGRRALWISLRAEARLVVKWCCTDKNM